MTRVTLVAALLGITSAAVQAVPINTNDPTVYATFSTGATVETFESTGLTPLGLSSYANAANSSTAVPAGAQLGGQITGLHFHSGGGSFNDPVGNPGTPTALLQLQAGIAGDARSGTNVVGALEIATENLDIDQFVEIIFTGGLQSRVGVWLNESLGPALFQAFDSTGSLLEAGVVGGAGNFVGIQRAANEISHISIVTQSASGFTIDDLTFAQVSSNGTAPEPGSLALLAVGLATGAFLRRRNRHRK